MARYSNEEINEVRIKSDIVDIIGEYIPLVKKGKNYFGVCPFHDDHTPSMSVSPEKQIYTCFVCGASGNIFSFLMDYDNLSFPEAVKQLADKAGLQLQNTINYNKVEKKYSNLYDIYKLSSKYYINNLNTKSGVEALNYLNKRNITKEVIDEFQIGLSLSKSNELVQFLLNKKINEKELEKVGLANSGDSGYYDVFRNRIMFPLWNINGDVIGYSGRIYNTEDTAKYVNTKETPIFKKGELLYNYHRAKNEARKEKSVILVEGFMDVIRMYTVGIKNVVALMGTSLTNTQINLLKKISNNIIICMDGDDAGDKATNSIIEELLKNNVEAKIVRLEDKLDPDEYIVKNGKEDFISKIENPMTYIQYKVSFLKKDKDFSNPEDISKYINQIAKFISKIDDDIVREILIKNISEEFDIDVDIIKAKIMPISKNNSVNKEEKIEIKNKDKYLKSERALIYYMLKSDEVCRMYELNIPYLPSLLVRVLADEIIEYKKNNEEFHIADFITTIQDKTEIVKLLGEIVSLELNDEVNMMEIDDYMRNLKEYIKNNEIIKIKVKIEEERDPVKQAALAEKIRKIKSEE